MLTSEDRLHREKERSATRVVVCYMLCGEVPKGIRLNKVLSLLIKRIGQIRQSPR